MRWLPFKYKFYTIRPKGLASQWSYYCSVVNGIGLEVYVTGQYNTMQEAINEAKRYIDRETAELTKTLKKIL